MAQFVRALMALALAAGALGDEAWADMASQQPRPNSTAMLHVQNRAAVPVRLMGCSGTAVAPNQSIDVPLAGMTHFWVAPNDTSVDCHTGPFDHLFYFAADLLGPKPIVTLGYGIGDKDSEEQDALAAANRTDPSGAASAAAADDDDDDDAVAGLELASGPPGGKQSSVRCREDKCERSQQAAEMAQWPAEFTLTVMGPQASMLSFWRRGPRGWGRGFGRPRGWGGRRHFGGRDWP